VHIDYIVSLVLSILLLSVIVTEGNYYVCYCFRSQTLITSYCCLQTSCILFCFRGTGYLARSIECLLKLLLWVIHMILLTQLVKVMTFYYPVKKVTAVLTSCTMKVYWIKMK